MEKNFRKGTLCVQGLYDPKGGEARVLPIVQSTTYRYEDSDEVADLFDLKKAGHMYSRISNPTVSAFEEKINALEGGVGAVAAASGQSATTLAFLNICQSGQHIVAASTIYGGTYNLLSTTFKKLGIEVSFVDPEADEDEIIKHFKENTRAIFGETIGNPGLNILDFEKFARIAKKMDVPFIVDNTLATPCLCRPFELGANIIIHSTTKYTDGHATSVGGVVIDGGNFNWDNGKYPELTEPDPSYHGIKYVESFGELAYIIKARVQLLRDYGCCMSPFNAFLFHLGLETLHLRMERHSQNALKLAQFLENHEMVNWVSYPSLSQHSSYEKCKKYLPDGASGILTFGIKGGAEAGKELAKHLKLVALVVHLGDARTSLLHPASTTHRQLTKEQQIASGVLPDLIRVSVGIENVEDLIEDFDQALNKMK
ncbi:O-acetylhomoserine aminocarboxypropyltransferase/cysteine synthase family protein [Crassaminicella profunda]|uniref:O-acetylhomoserine aminocarboxypropyltransferase/cysteine synthase family protein n=1 Tax=Crassaminicella profunda TaxID=1286698 RepID=UPI001CA6F265|nr:O-acetylhomoserine aminocarboxypropyltransferase/cysteine synthase family protein [Crassaminicella profunda]QZY56173.1 O-acetylhomoserine aminocarboxypropyltransferase/cysteine synthase [Crassaminicella profunda]